MSTLCCTWKEARRDCQGYVDLKLNEQCTPYFRVFVCYAGTAYFRSILRLYMHVCVCVSMCRRAGDLSTPRSAWTLA